MSRLDEIIAKERAEIASRGRLSAQRIKDMSRAIKQKHQFKILLSETEDGLYCYEFYYLANVPMITIYRETKDELDTINSILKFAQTEGFRTSLKQAKLSGQYKKALENESLNRATRYNIKRLHEQAVLGEFDNKELAHYGITNISFLKYRDAITLNNLLPDLAKMHANLSRLASMNLEVPYEDTILDPKNFGVTVD